MGGVVRKYNQNASAYAKIINTTMIKNELFLKKILFLHVRIKLQMGTTIHLEQLQLIKKN